MVMENSQGHAEARKGDVDRARYAGIPARRDRSSQMGKFTGKVTSALVGIVPGTNLLAEAGVPAQGGHCHPLLVVPEDVPDPSLWFTTLPPPPGHL